MTRGEQEITLDDALVAQLAVVGPDDPVQPSAELTVRVHAASIPDLDEGRFTLHVLGVSRAAGTAAGRFLRLLEAADQERLRAVYAALPGVHGDSLLAQVSAVPLYARSENVGRVRQVAGLVISLGEHRDVSPAQQVPVSDLAVTADARRLHLVSVSRRRPVHTILPSAVDLSIHTHPLARFLLEAPVALAAPCTAFDWGAASALPFLPALRYRRTVISPARWILTTSDLRGQDASWPQWNDARVGFRVTATCLHALRAVNRASAASAGHSGVAPQLPGQRPPFAADNLAASGPCHGSTFLASPSRCNEQILSHTSKPETPLGATFPQSGHSPSKGSLGPGTADVRRRRPMLCATTVRGH